MASNPLSYNTLAMPRLLIATNNPGKLAEFRRLLDGCGWELVSPADLGLALAGRRARTHLRGEC